MSDGAPISQEILLPTNVDDINAATKKLDEMIARVSKLEKASESHHKTTKEHTKEAEAGFHSLWDAMGKVLKREAELAVGIRAIGAAGLTAKGHIGEFFEFIGAEAALDVLKEIGEKVIDIGKEALHSAADAERMNFAIDAAAGGSEAGEKMRKWLKENAKHSEFTEDQNESAWQSLRYYGVDNQKSALFVKAAEDMAAISAPEKRSQVDQQVLEALARVHSQGRIQARSAMAMGIGVEDLKTLPGFKGLSNQKVWEKAEQSNIDENMLLNLIIKHTGEKGIGERSAQASELLLTRMSKLAELPKLFYKRLGETGATKKLGDEIGHIVEELDPESPTGRKIYGALESTFSLIADKVGEIDFDSIADSIRDDVVPAVKEMISLIGPTMDVIQTTIHGFGVAGHFLSGKKTGAEEAAAESAFQANEATRHGGGFFASTWASLKAPFLAHDAGLDADQAAVETPMGTMSRAQWRKLGGEAGHAHGEGYAQGIEASAMMSGDAAAGAGEASHEALMSSIDAHSPSRKTEEAGGHFGEGFALGIEGSAGRIEDAIDSTINIPSYGDNFASLAGKLRGDTNITVEVNVQTLPGQDPTGIGETVALAVRREVTALLERTGNEG